MKILNLVEKYLTSSGCVPSQQAEHLSFQLALSKLLGKRRLPVPWSRRWLKLEETNAQNLLIELRASGGTPSFPGDCAT